MTSGTEVSSPGRVADSVETLAALRTAPGVRDAVVTEHADAEGTVTLGYVSGPDPALGTAWLRQHLLSRLPHHMIPEHFVVVDDFPLTVDGDYDLDALPGPPAESGQYDTYVAPRSAAEQQITDAMKQLIGVERVGVYDGFFGLGGSSILATQLTRRLREIFGVELLLRDVFASPTAAGLAQLITCTQQMSGAEKRRARRRRRWERAFRYVVGHPILVSTVDRVRRLLPARRRQHG
jgi:Phosphopantetheine attachment site/AMP-binding enzyme C-terminal domain